MKLSIRFATAGAALFAALPAWAQDAALQAPPAAVIHPFTSEGKMAGKMIAFQYSIPRTLKT